MTIKITIFLSLFLHIVFVYGESDRDTSLDKKLQTSKFSSCFDGLGCIDTTEQWYHNVYRPENLEPLDRHTIRTEFISITKSTDPKKPLHFETLNLKNDLFQLQQYNNTNGIIMMIHDFTSNGNTGWVKHLATSLLNRKDLNVNILSVDWEAGAEPPFKQAISNARVVALEIKLLVETIHKDYPETKNNFIHIIGHGVGAHIAGYVGGYVKIKRITALDPTGPSFEHMPAIVRLDPADAQYIEVLHTDAYNRRSQGSITSLGHADFFINGAKLQPRCNESNHLPAFTSLDRNSLKEGMILPACSHKRSFKYYIESIDFQECEYTGFLCDNYEDFKNGKCTSCTLSEQGIPMCTTFGLVGPASTASSNKYYLNTGGISPYCLNPYKLEIHIDKNANFKSSLRGYFEIIMLDDKGIMTTAQPASGSNIFLFEAGKSNVFIYYAYPPRLHKIVEARLKWVHNPNSLCVVFCNTSIYVKKLVIQLLSSDKSKVSQEHFMCPKRGVTEIANGNYAVFYRCKESSTKRSVKTSESD